MCPCKEGRIGAFVTVLFLCLALEWWGDLPSMLAQLKAGVPLAIGWAIFAGCGVVLLLDGIRQALSHDDGFDGGSFIWSVGVIGLAFYGLSHHWYLTDGSSVQTSRALWFSWMASNAFNIWLQLRGQLRGLRLPRFPSIPTPQRAPRASVRRRRSIEVIEEFEGLGIDADDLAGLLARLTGSTSPGSLA